MMALVIKYTVVTSVILLMLTVGLRTPLDQVVDIARRFPLLLRGLATNFVVAPALIYLSIRWLPVTTEVKTGVMLMAAAPIAPMAPLPFVGIAKGDIAYSAGLMVIAAVLSVALTPLILTLSLPSSGEGIEVNPWQIIQTLVTVQLIPISIGMAIRRVSPTWNQRLLGFVPRIAQWGLIAGIGMLLASQAQQMLSIGLLGFGINMVLVVLCLAVGHVTLIGESGELRRALAVSTAVRNIPLAFVIANTSFPGTLVPPVTLVFAIFSMILSVMYGKLMVRQGS